jgi:exonuclease III
LGALTIRPRLAGPVIVAGLIALGPVMGFRTGWRRWFAGNAPRQLRVITFNTEGGYNRNVAEIPIALLRYQPDILAFQECLFDPTRPEIWPAGWTFRLSAGGVCLATRFPIREEVTLERIRTGDQGGTGNAVLFRLDTGPRIVDVVVVHLETPRKGLESLRYGGRFSRMAPNLIIREIGATRVRRWIDQQSRDAIIAGDFNMPVESRIYRKIFGDCTNAHSTAGHGFGWTRVLRWFSVRIDQVIACGAWIPLHAEVGSDLGSDHLPLIVDLRHP